MVPPPAASAPALLGGGKKELEQELDSLHQKANAEIDLKRLNVLQRALAGEMTVATCARLLKAYVDRGKQNLKMSFRYGRRGGGTAMDEARKDLVSKVATKAICIEEGLAQLKALDQAQLAKKEVRFDVRPGGRTVVLETWSRFEYNREKPAYYDPDGTSTHSTPHSTPHIAPHPAQHTAQHPPTRAHRHTHAACALGILCTPRAHTLARACIPRINPTVLSTLLVRFYVV